jgi:hypothetical protein
VHPIHLCTMADINPSPLGVVGASIEGADMSVFFCCPGAIIIFTLIFHQRLWLVGFMRQRWPVGIFFDQGSRLVGAAYANGRGVVGLSTTTAAAALAVRLFLSPCPVAPLPVAPSPSSSSSVGRSQRRSRSCRGRELKIKIIE